MCDPRVFCASNLPSFLARWRARGPAGTGPIDDSGGEGSGGGGTGRVPLELLTADRPYELRECGSSQNIMMIVQAGILGGT